MGEQVAGRRKTEDDETRHAISVDSETVGYLAVRQAEIATDNLALAFQSQQKRGYLLIVLLTLLLASLASLVLARRLIRPIRAIAAGAQELSAGRYGARIAVERNDELGRLAEDFNRLAATLERNERMRRQWIADISHELRTPLAILRGEIEALLDGVRQVSPEHLRSLHGEVIGLGKLVDDLYELALSDLGALEHKRERLDLAELLDEVADGFRRRFEKKSLRLDNDAHGPMWMCGDPQRLRQLLANLLENSRRYTDSGGRLRITTERSAGHYRLRFEDTAPAVSDTDLPRLFERLYRVDKSRSRSLGGAGLGLSICYNIVTAHDGRIRAEHSPLGGLAIVVELPAEGDKPK